jgi:hypothetical protein
MWLQGGNWLLKRQWIIGMMFSGLCLILFAIEKGECVPFPPPGFDGPSTSSFIGNYTNPNYFFTVTIPKGFVGHSAAPPAPQHGFGIILSWETHSYFWFDSSANSALWDDEKEALRDILDKLRSSAQEILSAHESRTILGRQPARKQVVCYVCKGHPSEKRIQVIILSLKRGLVDEAGLLTTSDRFAADYKIFMATLATWHATEHSDKKK